jgi:hypothetical protein
MPTGMENMLQSWSPVAALILIATSENNLASKLRRKPVSELSRA